MAPPPTSRTKSPKTQESYQIRIVRLSTHDNAHLLADRALILSESVLHAVITCSILSFSMGLVFLRVTLERL